MSVVNGAQTIGAIWEHAGQGELLEPNSMLHLRLISLENADDGFGSRVTTGTNTQKNILPRDFATFDSMQVAIQKQFQLEGRVYIIRDTDQLRSPDEGCTMMEAAIALACNKSIELATIAYRNLGFLSDPSNRYHKQAFDGATAEKVFPLVKVLRISDSALASIKSGTTIKARPLATHGAKYIQYRVFNHSDVKQAMR